MVAMNSEEYRRANVAEQVLDPDPDCVDGVLRLVKPGPLTRLVSSYFEHSQASADLCLGLHHNLRRARSLYAPLQEVLEGESTPLDKACQVLAQFDAQDNPFPDPDSSCRHLDHVCSGFSNLKLQVQAARRGRPKWRLLLLLVCRGASPRRRRRGAKMAQVEAVGKGSFVVHDLQTIQSLVGRLHCGVQEHKRVVRLALELGPGTHMVVETINHLRNNILSFLRQLHDLHLHLCLCFNTINNARSLLLQHIYTYQCCWLTDD